MIQVPDPEGPDFNKSYLVTRLIIGIIGVALPVVVIVADHVLFNEPWPRDSLSAYYHSGMREWFVGSLCAMGVGLFTYMGARPRSFDNVISILAGVAAILVALFPTKDVRGTLNPLQKLLGEDPVWMVHFGAAAVFVGLSGLICWSFGTRDGRRTDRTAKQQVAWRGVHRGCALAIWASIAFIAVTMLADVWRTYAVLIGEVIALGAFSLSWFCKGSELFSFFRHRDRFSTGKCVPSR